jgi:fatty-acyl-CoA synthase
VAAETLLGGGRTRPQRGGPAYRRVRRALNLAIAGAGVAVGLMEWANGFAAFAAWASPRLALVTVATGLAALVAAVITDFDRMWLRALLALTLTATTIAGYLVSRAAPAEAPAPAQAQR